MASRRTIWTDERMRRVVELREKHRMTWDAIGARFGVAGSLACTRYHTFKSRLRIAEKRKELGLHDDPPPRARQAPKTTLRRTWPDGTYIEVPVTVEPVKRPRYFSDADADIRARIAAQGLTAGFLGDPPPGRSALDQREGRK